MQEVRILLNEDEARLPTSQFLESGILSLVMSFINYDFRSFERLRDEALRLVTSLLFCDSKPVIDCVIEEGYLNRIKMILLDAQVTPLQVGLIVNAIGNIVGTEQEYVGLIISSGIFDLLLVETRKFDSDQEAKAQLIWLICNMLRCRKHLTASKATDLLSLLLDFYEQLTDRDMGVFQEVVWAILLYMSCVEDNSLAISFLSSRNITPGIFKAFEDLQSLDLIRALQEIIYRISSTRKKENGLFTPRTVEVESAHQKVFELLASNDLSVVLKSLKIINHLLDNPGTFELAEPFVDERFFRELMDRLTTLSEELQEEILVMLELVLTKCSQQKVMALIDQNPHVGSAHQMIDSLLSIVQRNVDIGRLATLSISVLSVLLQIGSIHSQNTGRYERLTRPNLMKTAVLTNSLFKYLQDAMSFAKGSHGSKLTQFFEHFD